MMLKSKVTIGGIPVEITRKANLKNLYIRVFPPYGEVRVSSPMEVSDEDIRLFVLRRLPELNRVRERMVALKRQRKREYVSGEAHYLWGKPYRLQVIYEGTQYKIRKTPTKIILTAPAGATKEAKEAAVTEWYREELKRVLESVIPRCEARTGICVNEVKVKNMRTRWGTCNIDKRRIWLNLQLVKKPPECLEYVLIHELVHLLEKNHTHRFHALVEEFCPTWKDAKKLLEELPLDYLDKETDDTDGEKTDNE